MEAHYGRIEADSSIPNDRKKITKKFYRWIAAWFGIMEQQLLYGVEWHFVDDNTSRAFIAETAPPSMAAFLVDKQKRAQ
jgi:hypothetical protein